MKPKVLKNPHPGVTLMGENRDYIVYPEEKGSINISEEVIAVIAANAALETEGVAGLSASLGKDIAELLGKKNIYKGVKITAADDGLKVDVFLLAKVGTSVNRLAVQVQDNVVAAIESTTGIKATQVNVNVCGVSLERDK